MIEFSSYAFDLSTFASRASVPAFKPAERQTTYLLNPNPEDRYYQQFPERFSAELHNRITAPLYAFIFAVLPLAYLSQAQSIRSGRSLIVAAIVGAAFFVRAIGYYLGSMAEFNAFVIPLLYLLPIATTLFAVFLILRGIQLRVPEQVVTFTDSVVERLSGLVRKPAAPQASQSRYR
jgi:lipopolysaccharide export system permease protein